MGRILQLDGQRWGPNVAAFGGEPWWLSGGIAPVSCVAAYQPKGAADLASSYINLANPGTYNAAPGVAPVFDAATGWFANSVAYLATGIVPGGITWSMFARFSDGAGGTGITVAGCYVLDTQSFLIHPHADWANRYNCFNGGVVNLGVGVAYVNAGVLGFAGKEIYLNGLNTATIPAAGTVPAITIYLMGLHFGAGMIQGWPGWVQAVAIYNVTLTPAQVLSLTNAMNLL